MFRCDVSELLESQIRGPPYVPAQAGVDPDLQCMLPGGLVSELLRAVKLVRCRSYSDSLRDLIEIQNMSGTRKGWLENASNYMQRACASLVAVTNSAGRPRHQTPRFTLDDVMYCTSVRTVYTLQCTSWCLC